MKNEKNPKVSLTRRDFFKSTGAGLLASEFVARSRGEEGANVKFSPAIAQGTRLRWHETTAKDPWRDQKLVVLENDLVSVALLPQSGGRLVRYVDHETGDNHLFEDSDSETKVDFWWRNSGGIWDKEGVYSAPNICDRPFAYRVQQAPDRLEMLLETDLGNLHVTKKYRLNSGSTRLSLEATYRNTSAIPICTFFSHIFSLAPGGTTGGEGFVVYPDGDGLVKKRFSSRVLEGPRSLSPSWWMVSNLRRGVSLLMTYEQNPLLSDRIIRSVGAPSWELARGCGSAHANAIRLELRTRRHLAKADEALTVRWDIRLIKHGSEGERAWVRECFLPEAQRQGMIRFLAPLIQNSPEVFADIGEHLLVFPWGILSFLNPHGVVRNAGPLLAEIRTMRFAGGDSKGLPSGTLHLLLDRNPCVELPLNQLEPNTTDIHYCRVRTTKLAVGNHSLRMAADGRAINAPFTVIQEKNIATRIERAQRKSAELAQEARNAGDASRIGMAASCAMRAEDARRKFIMGPAFEEGGNGAYDVEVDRLPLKLSVNIGPADVDYIMRVLEETETWIEALTAGHNPFCERTGLFQKAFYSKVDGSLQPYTLFVPKEYSKTVARPLLVLLQGSGGSQWEIPQLAMNLDGHSPYGGALERKPQEPNFLLCSSLARGPSGFVQIAEVDVLQMLDEIQRDYHVDADRIYAMGWSMGGGGSYLLASRFADRFAAVMPIAGGVDTTLLANAHSVPCWAFQELGDTNVSPGYTNVATTACRALGMPYHEGIWERPFVWRPWSDHLVGYRMSGDIDEIENILGTYRRVDFPKDVRLTTTELRHNRSYWVRIDSFASYYKPASLRAHIEDSTIEVTSSNVRSFTLFLASSQIRIDGSLRVKQNGRVVFDGKPGEELHIGPRFVTAGIHKQHGLSGPLSDILYEPFMIVYGAQGSNVEMEAGRREAEAIRTEGLRGVRFYGIPVRSESEVSSEDIERYHLLLVGTLKSSRLMEDLQSRLPVHIEGDAVYVGHRCLTGKDIGFRLIYPNPLNPQKYLVVCGAPSHKGLQGLASIPTPFYGWTQRVMEPDLLITDYRSNGLYPRYVAAMTFDNDWQFETRGPVLGRLEMPLSRLGIECGWGDFRADAVREATGADVAFVEVDDHLYPQELSAGSIALADINMANNYSSIYMFETTGAKLREALEHMIERYLRGLSIPAVQTPWFGSTRRPVAISGFSYAFNTTRPYGERVEMCSLKPQKTYLVAVTEHVLCQSTKAGGGWGYLGWLPKIRYTGMNEVDAQILYFRKHEPLKPSTVPRITEI